MTRPVEEPPPGVKTLRQESNGTFLRQQRICKGEQRIHRIARRTTISRVEIPLRIEIPWPQCRPKRCKVLCCDRALQPEEGPEILCLRYLPEQCRHLAQLPLRPR